MTEPAMTTVNANGLAFRCLTAGEDGPLALCLHGFPDSPWSYRHLLPRLAAAGYRAVAPAMRGYAPTAVPDDGDYRTCTLAADVNALHEALGGDGRAVVVAHDWGAVAAYGALAAEPGRWSRAVIGNVPPFALFGEVMLSYPQIRRSFYFWFFQMAIAPAVVAADDLAFIAGLWGDWSPGFDARAELEWARGCLRSPENLSAALGYYRALFDPQRFGTPEASAEQAAVWGRPLTHPVLYVHGARDGCIALDEARARRATESFGTGSEVAWLEDAGHFFLVERPDAINDRVLRFLGAPAAC